MAARARLSLVTGGALAVLVAACTHHPAPVPMPSFPAQASVDCFVPTRDDYSVTIVVHDSTFVDSAYLRPLLGAIARHWPVATPLPRYSVDVGFQIFRDGRATDPRIVHASHIRAFDDRARAAVRAALDDSTWPIPKRYAHDTLDALVRFGPPDANGAVVQTWYSIVKPPKPRRDNPRPAFPVERQQGQQVIAQFIVDTLGGVDSTSVQILSSTDDDYAAAVLAVLPRWKFTPSMLRGCKVERTVRWEFPERER